MIFSVRGWAVLLCVVPVGPGRFLNAWDPLYCKELWHLGRKKIENLDTVSSVLELLSVNECCLLCFT